MDRWTLRIRERGASEWTHLSYEVPRGTPSNVARMVGLGHAFLSDWTFDHSEISITPSP